MSKNKKAGKRHNPNRPRSKNNPAGKRNGPRSTGQCTIGMAGEDAAHGTKIADSSGYGNMTT